MFGRRPIARANRGRVTDSAQQSLVQYLRTFPGARIIIIGENGLTVSAWTDQSGAGNSVSQGTGAAQPSITTLNGRSGARFDGTDDYMATAADHGVHGQASVSSFAVLNLRGVALDSNDRFWGNTGTAADYYGWTFGQVSAGKPDFGVGDGTAIRWTAGPNSLSSASGLHVFDARAISGSIKVWDNGTVGTELTDAWAGTIACNSAKAIGAFESAGAFTTFAPVDQFLQADFAPCLTEAQHTAIRARIRSHYGF
jgi:hypothetical protein